MTGSNKPRQQELLDVISSLDALDRDEYVFVDYRIAAGEGLTIDESAVQLAVMTALGTSPALSHEQRADRMNSTAKVISINRGDRIHHVRIAYPVNLCEPRTGLSQLVAVLSLAAEYDFVKSIWVEDFICPSSFLKHFPGPRWGINGIRGLMGIRDRPLLGVIVKPRSGVSLAVVGESVYRALLGGADYVIDDELVTDPHGEFCAPQRFAKLAGIAEKATRESGSSKAYFANVSASPLRALGLSVQAEELGANGLLVNGYSMGIGALSELSSNPDIHVPVLTCNMGWAMLSRTSDATGMSEVAMAKLSRIAGADGVYSGILGSSWYSEAIFRQSLAALRQPMHAYNESFPVIAGGLTPLNLLDNLGVQGRDVMVQAGSAIFRHPGGSELGAKAFRLILDAFDPARSQEENAEILGDLWDKHLCVRDILKAHKYRSDQAGRK